MALSAASRQQSRMSVLLLFALLQAAGRAPTECAAAPRRALTTGSVNSHSTTLHHPVSQSRHRTLLDNTGGALVAGDSADESTSGNSSNPANSAGIVAGVFLGLALLGTVAGCTLVRVCAGAPAEVVDPGPASAATEGKKGNMAQEIPVLTGLRISQPDGTFVCAIDGPPSADLQLGGSGRCCTAACSRAYVDQQGCNGCGCSAAAKV